MTQSSPWDRMPNSIAEEIDKNRQDRFFYFYAASVAFIHLLINGLINIDASQLSILHLASFMIVCVWLNPISTHKSWQTIDRLVFFVVALACLYISYAEDQIYERGVHLDIYDWIAGAVTILGVIELTRRTTGWIIPILILTGLSYVVWWGDLLSGVFRFSSLSPETLMFRSLYGDDALFGTISRISATFVFIFIIFGAFLLRSGAGDFVIHLSNAIAQKITGGPGIIAVISSGLTGTISGSAIANTASTGVITIPMMIKAGFPPRFAAAVEAAASTGGQLMPPIMGAGAFVMASYTQIPYATIVLVSILPAILYFMSLIFYIQIEAKKYGIKGVQIESMSIWTLLFKEGLSFILPIITLITLFIIGYTPVYAGVAAITVIIISSWFTPTKLGFKGIIDALALATKNMATTAILLCTVGLIINVIVTAGIGNTFSLMIADWSGGSLLLAITLVALASLILGMGLPVTASYIVLATLSAPALFNLIAQSNIVEALVATPEMPELSAIIAIISPELLPLPQSFTVAEAQAFVQQLPTEAQLLLHPILIDEQSLTMILLAAHLIIFWLSQDSNITPPVCLCTFTAAAIAKTHPMLTGLTSWKVAKALYIIPCLFAFTPFITGDFSDVIQVFVVASFGLFAFTLAMQGFYTRPLNIALRVIILSTAIILIYPFNLIIHIGTITFLLLLLIWLKRQTVQPHNP